MEEINDIIVMKVGPHSGMSLDEIIESKREEEKGNGVHYWGYSGVFCRPLATQEFCKRSVRNTTKTCFTRDKKCLSIDNWIY